MLKFGANRAIVKVWARLHLNRTLLKPGGCGTQRAAPMCGGERRGCIQTPRSGKRSRLQGGEILRLGIGSNKGGFGFISKKKLGVKRGAMATEIAVMLAVTDGNAAVEFYQRAFGAEVYWTVGAGGHIVAGLAIGGARFFLATESPEFGTRGPSSAGFTTVRIELFVDDPVAVNAKAVAAGAKQRSEVKEHKLSDGRTEADREDVARFGGRSVRAYVVDREVFGLRARVRDRPHGRANEVVTSDRSGGASRVSPRAGRRVHRSEREERRAR